MLTLKIKIGRTQLEFEAEDVKKIHRFSSVYGALPEKCDACKSDDIFLSWKSPEGFNFYVVKCKSCGAELLIHEKKDGGGFYVKADEKMEKYIPKQGEEKKQKQEEDQIPF